VTYRAELSGRVLKQMHGLHLLDVPLVTHHPWSGSGWFTGAPVAASNL